MNYIPVDDTAFGMLGIAVNLVMLVFVSGIPLGILAISLAVRTRGRGTRWPAGWSSAFLGALAFQAGSLAISLFLLWMVIMTVLNVPGDELFGEPAIVAAVVAGATTLNILGLRSWLALRNSVAATRREGLL